METITAIRALVELDTPHGRIVFVPRERPRIAARYRLEGAITLDRADVVALGLVNKTFPGARVEGISKDDAGK